MEKKIIGQNLRRIRLEEGLSQKSVAFASGISYVAYSNIERGVSSPKDETLKSIAKTLGVSISEIWKRDDALKHIRFISGSKLLSKDKILLEVENWLEDRINADKLFGLTPSSDFDKLVRKIKSELAKKNKSDKTPAGIAASYLRNEWKLDQYPISNIGKLFENRGIKVFGYSLQSAHFSSFSIGSKSGGPAIVINTWDEIPVEEWIFNAAKELGHLILHQDSYDVSCSEEQKAEQTEAKDFANELLMPESAFLNEWNYYIFLNLKQAILNTKKIFNVGWKAVLLRFLTLANKHIETGDPEGAVMRDEITKVLEEYKLHIHSAKEPAPLSEADFWGMDKPDKIFELYFNKYRIKTNVPYKQLQDWKPNFYEDFIVSETEPPKYMLNLDSPLKTKKHKC